MIDEAFASRAGLRHARGLPDLLRHAGRMPGRGRASRDRAGRGRAGHRRGRGARLADLAARAAPAARRGAAGALGTARRRGGGMLRRGADLARTQQSRALALRAATSLARLWRRERLSGRLARLARRASIVGFYGRVRHARPARGRGASSTRSAGCACPCSPPRAMAPPDAGQGGVPGPHRLVPPEETLARLRPHLAAWASPASPTSPGSTASACPWSPSCRPNARSLAVSQGKGLSLAAAKVSAIMEAAELYHAETISGPLWWARPDELSGERPFLDPLELPRSAAAPDYDGPIAWIEGVDLRHGGTILVPVRRASAPTIRSRPDVLGAGLVRHHRRPRRRATTATRPCCRA